MHWLQLLDIQGEKLLMSRASYPSHLPLHLYIYMYHLIGCLRLTPLLNKISLDFFHVTCFCVYASSSTVLHERMQSRTQPSQSKVLIEVASTFAWLLGWSLPCWASGLPGPLLGLHLAPYPGPYTHIWHRWDLIKIVPNKTTVIHSPHNV